jgi:hypothetical protein
VVKKKTNTESHLKVVMFIFIKSCVIVRRVRLLNFPQG